MADTNDGDIKAEIGVVCYLARKAIKAQKVSDSHKAWSYVFFALYIDIDWGMS
jgi:hypothetical protein